MVKILGLPFDDFVKGQFEIRQKELSNHQKSPQNLAVFNSNTSWVRLTSGVKVEPAKAKTLSETLNIGQSSIEGNALAKNLVLWGGITSFSTGSLDPLKGGIGYGINNAYGFLSGPEQGLKPMPGIENISCTYKNNGSLKQATVKLKCFTRSQFEALEAVYLRLGYTLVLEWGNVNYFDNNGEFKKIDKYSIPNLLFKSNDTINPNTVQSQLYSNKKETNGNYDGMLAKVSNFSWQLNNDLSFDITLNLISVGDIIDSLKVNIGGSSFSSNITSQLDFSGSIQNIVTIQATKNSSIINAFLAELYDEVYSKQLTSGPVSGKTKEIIAQANDLIPAIQSQTLEKIQKTFLGALEEFKRPYTLWKNALDSRTAYQQKESENNKALEAFSAFDSKGLEARSVFLKENSTANLLEKYQNAKKELQNGADIVFDEDTLFDDNSVKDANNYNNSLKTIEDFITNLKYGTDNGYKYADTYIDQPRDVIINTLRGGPDSNDGFFGIGDGLGNGKADYYRLPNAKFGTSGSTFNFLVTTIFKISLNNI